MFLELHVTNRILIFDTVFLCPVEKNFNYHSQQSIQISFKVSKMVFSSFTWICPFKYNHDFQLHIPCKIDKCTIFIFQLKRIGDEDFFKCLAMYEAEPQLKVDELTMENTVKDINKLAMTIIQQIAVSDQLHHSSHLPVNAFDI